LITQSDIERAVVASFGEAERAEVLSALGSYEHQWGKHFYDPADGANFVKMTIVTLANGDLGELKRLVATANKDYLAVATR
jgi:hypothetical protein